MFRKRTVFIVGAGCSAEFGLPIGSALLDDMHSTFSSKSEKFEQFCDAYLRSGVPGANGNVDQRLMEFRAGLSTAPSIDQYLDFHRDDPLFVMLGKCALATEILHAESASEMREETVRDPLPDRWLRRLTFAMMNGTDRSAPERIFSNVSFICFNYDRLIELFFRRAIQGLLHCSAAECEDLVANNLRIWHPYGTVGSTKLAGPGISASSYSFSRDRIHWDEILSAAKSLRTFTEGAADKDEREEIGSALVEAQQIVFLGFSYLEDNMRLLRTTPIATQAGEIYGTTFKTAAPNVEIALRSIDQSLGSGHGSIRDRIRLVDLSASEFISQYGTALRS